MSIAYVAAALESDLPPTERLVAIALGNHANEDGVCWPSWDRLKQTTGLSRASIGRSLSALEERGWIRKEHRLDEYGRLRSCTYVFTVELGVSQRDPTVSQRDVGGLTVRRGGSHSETGGGLTVRPRNVKKETSVEPSVVTQPERDDFSAQEQEILEHLKAVTGRRHRTLGPNGKARLREGMTVEQAKLVIDFKWDAWGYKPEMVEYVRPSTLFGKQKWPEYLAEAESWDEAGRPDTMEMQVKARRELNRASDPRLADARRERAVGGRW
ncbi:MAG: conserved phage C-terminal domain-containing protein [Myxococcota bacterium]